VIQTAEETTMRLTLVLALAAFTAPAFAGGGGLVASPDALGPRWQLRAEVDTRLSFGLWAGEPLGPASGVQTTRLLGDFQLGALRLGQAGGLRLTGGLLLNSRPPSAGADPHSAWPYFGIGYAGGVRGDWGFSADVGLAAQNPGAVGHLGSVFSGRVDLNDALRELRLQPMIRLGVTYSF
jgi:hypothetical protein